MPALTPADLELLGIIFLSYVVGSIPPAYIAGRLIGGIDLRHYGSGNVGGANLWKSVAPWLVLPIGILEVLKGAGCVLIAREAGFDQGGQMLAGICALVGHNWSLFLGLRGGRGTGVIIGILLLLAPLQLALFAASGLLGLALGMTPIGVLLGLALTPMSALFLGEHVSLTLGGLAILGIIGLKRLWGNDGWPRAEDWREALFLRLFLDRDVRRRDEWVSRRPGQG